MKLLQQRFNQAFFESYQIISIDCASLLSVVRHRPLEDWTKVIMSKYTMTLLRKPLIDNFEYSIMDCYDKSKLVFVKSIESDNLWGKFGSLGKQDKRKISKLAIYIILRILSKFGIGRIS